MVQDTLLIWLDSNIDEENYRNAIIQLPSMINTIDTFSDGDKCIDFLTDIHTENVFMIISGELSECIVPLIHNIPQLDSIFIFCGNKICHQDWTKEWPKIKGIFTEIIPIGETLREAAKQCEHNAIGISFMSSTSGALNANLDELECSFMYTQIMKEILLTIEFTQQDINKFTSYCREIFVGNRYKLNSINEFERKYRTETPIWWYTCDSFLYPMLNRALRTMDVDIIIKMGFFIRDLHQHIEQLHSEQFGRRESSQLLTVYRGQSLSKTDFDQVVQTKGGLMSFNNFLSTSKNRDMSMTFAHEGLFNPDIVGILFVITMDPSKSSTPFASINDVSCFQEDEILFSMHTVFRIREIKQMSENNCLWQVNLTLTSDNDQELRALTEHIREETCPGKDGWYRLGVVLLRIGQSEKAQQVYEMLLDRTTDNGEKAMIHSLLGWAKKDQGENDEALTFYKKSHEIYQKVLPPDHVGLAHSYNNIGLVYDLMCKYSEALTYYKNALEIYHKNVSSNHPDLARPYNNIGLIYEKLGECSKALSSLEKALEIQQKALPSNHPDLCTSNNNIGLVCHRMGDYPKALSYYKKALEIRQKVLPSNHPTLASSYSNIGCVYHNMDD